MTRINLIPTKPINVRRPIFYRDKRIFLSFLMSIPICYFVGIFPGIFMHFAIGVIVDLWLFKIKKVRESDIVSDRWLKKHEMSREQLDYYSRVFSGLRLYSLLACSIAGLAAYQLQWGIGFEGGFCLAFFVFRMLSGFYIAPKKIRYPWLFINFQARNMDYIGTDIDDSLDPLGLTNPISPNYIFK